MKYKTIMLSADIVDNALLLLKVMELVILENDNADWGLGYLQALIKARTQIQDWKDELEGGAK